MTTQTTSPAPERKKRIEQRYIEEARRASSIFPAGELAPYEKPDFLLRGTGIGIELTELCREDPRAQAGRLTKIPNKAKKQYHRLPNAAPVDVSIAFWREEHVSVKDLTTSLANFVHAHQKDIGTNFTSDLPDGYCSIGVFEPYGTVEGRWRSNRGFDVISTPKELIEACIAEKTERVPTYRLAASEVWLLIVNDHFLGPGEVRTDPDRLTEWTFKSDFDKDAAIPTATGRGRASNRTPPIRVTSGSAVQEQSAVQETSILVRRSRFGALVGWAPEPNPRLGGSTTGWTCNAVSTKGPFRDRIERSIRSRAVLGVFRAHLPDPACMLRVAEGIRSSFTPRIFIAISRGIISQRSPSPSCGAPFRQDFHRSG